MGCFQIHKNNNFDFDNKREMIFCTFLMKMGGVSSKNFVLKSAIVKDELPHPNSLCIYEELTYN